MNAKIFPSVVLFLATACSRPDVAACEASIKSELKAPSTYRRISETDFDETVSADRLIPMYGSTTATERAALHAEEKKHGLKLRTLWIEYEAANSFGVPLRNTKMCIFKWVAGRDSPSVRLDTDHQDVVVDRIMNETAAEIGANTEPADTVECCL